MAEVENSSAQGGDGSSLNWCALVADLSEACAGGRSFDLLPIYRSTIKLTAAHVDVLLTKHLGDPADPTRRHVAQAISEAVEYFLPAVVLQSYPTPGASTGKLKAIEDAAHKLRNALNLSSDDSTRLWLRQGATWDDAGMKGAVEVVRFIEQAARHAQEMIPSEKKARKGRPSEHAHKVAVHRLGLVWMHAFHLEFSYQIEARPFLRFARAFFDGMGQCTSAEFSDQIAPSSDTLRKHLESFKRMLRQRKVEAPKAEAQD